MPQKSQPFGATLIAGGLVFPFHVWFKPERFGDVDVAHAWMDTGTIYGQRNRPALNLPMLVDYFWMRCTLGGTSHTASAQETYVLAQLTPHARGNGSQRVLPDARWARFGRLVTSRKDAAEEVERLLRSAAAAHDPVGHALSMREFRDCSANALDCPRYKPAAIKAYHDVAGPFLARAENGWRRGGRPAWTPPSMRGRR